MAKILCIVLLVLALAVLKTESCQNLLQLEAFELRDRLTNRVVTRLPLRRTKYLRVKISLKATQLLNREWFSARLSAKAKVFVYGFSLDIDVPCALPAGCEFRQMSCQRTQEYLGITHIGCPLRAASYTATAYIPPVGDLTGPIPSWARNIVSEVRVTGRFDVWDNRGAQIGCISTSLTFYKDY